MELHERFINGDPDAFETLFRQFQKEVFGWIVRIVRDPGIAEDLTVETFWRVYRARARFDPGRSFGAWARRIATNVSYDHLKSARKEVELAETRAQEAPPDPSVAQDTRRRIRLAFDKLPPKLRLTATLALIEERPYEEIAEALGIPVGTVKSRIFRAVRMLRRDLNELGVEP
jgi:RNA polymerase sigma-70 factor, ECF subfamily